MRPVWHPHPLWTTNRPSDSAPPHEASSRACACVRACTWKCNMSCVRCLSSYRVCTLLSWWQWQNLETRGSDLHKGRAQIDGACWPCQNQSAEKGVDSFLPYPLPPVTFCLMASILHANSSLSQLLSLSHPLARALSRSLSLALSLALALALSIDLYTCIYVF